LYKKQKSKNCIAGFSNVIINYLLEQGSFFKLTEYDGEIFNSKSSSFHVFAQVRRGDVKKLKSTRTAIYRTLKTS